jgi:hypothetical protein
MADPLGISASIIAVLQLIGTIVQYLDRLKSAPQERQRILDELISIAGILSVLKDLAERQQHGDGWIVTIRSLSVPRGPLEQFKTALECLVAKLEPVHGLRNLGKRVIWPFQTTEIQDILRVIERQKSLFNLALQNDHM